MTSPTLGGGARLSALKTMWRNPTRSVVLGVAIFAYVIAVMHRTSFGVAGLEAAERFHTTAVLLSTFVLVQLGVYAGMQIPVGMLLDRFGSRTMIVGGSVIMAAGQITLSQVDVVSWAIVARVLIGAGDACLFISVLRLIPVWVPPQKAPLMTQVVSMLGQLGQVLSAVPFMLLLGGKGWSFTFFMAGAIGVAAGVAALFLVRDTPGDLLERELPATPAKRIIMVHLPDADTTLRSTISEPGTWLGFWSHLVTGFSAMVVMLLWGVPFLRAGHGLTEAQASMMLLVNTTVALIASPLIGILSARHPLRRSWLVLGIAGAIALAWVMVLVPSGPLPIWQLALWIGVIGLGGPGSMIGFDFARMFNAPNRQGKATGVVNVGGFLAALLSVLAVGWVLDTVGDGTPGNYQLEDFRIAFSVMLVPWVIGVVGVIAARKPTRRVMAERGVPVPPLREAVRRHRRSRP